MKPEYVICRREMYIGQMVAAMYTDNLWYRARIVKCYQEEFQVFYVDYGSKGWVTIDRLRHLDLHFTQLPIQAFCGRIFGIRHLPTETKWSTESSKWFLDLIKGKLIHFIHHAFVFLPFTIRLYIKGAKLLPQ